VHSIATSGGLIVALDDADVCARAREVVQLRGRIVMPGFNDAHHHLALRGRRIASLDVSHDAAPTKESLLDRVRDRATETPEGTWIRGGGFDQNRIGGFPTRQELDAASGGRPVLLSHVSEHLSVVSTEALRRVGIDDPADVPTMPGGLIQLGADGSATGLLLENAKKWFDSNLKPHATDEIVEFLRAGSDAAIREGITSVTDPGVGSIDGIGMGPADLHAYQRAREDGALRVRVTAMPYILATHAIDRFAPGADGWGLDLGIRTGFGDDRLRIGAVKVLTDGSLIGRSAAVHEPYCAHDDGMLLFDPRELADTIAALHRSGWQIAAHAIGDRAVDLAIDHLVRAQTETPRQDPRHRIEHCGIASDEAVRRIAAAGIVPVPQGQFIRELGDGFLDALGDERADLVYRVRSFLDAGVEVPGSSDTPVVSADPLDGIRSLVERRTESGRILGRNEAITVEQAVRSYTHGSAFAAGEESRKGRLAPGMLADMAILDGDIFSDDRAVRDGVSTTATVLAGSLVHGADELE
jgi:predicted amidohydrolase YtcJ